MARRGRPRKGERRELADPDLDESTPVDFEFDGLTASDVGIGDGMRELELATSSGVFARRRRE